MRRLGGLLVTLFFAITLTGSQLLAQHGSCRAAQGDGMAMHGRMYDADNVKTVKGKVTAIERVSMKMCGHTGVHLTLESEAEKLSIHLGPAWYIDNQEQTLEVGDEIEVMGSAVTHMGEAAIIAAEVRRGDAVLKLRDDQGYPVWRGWRHHGRAPSGTSG